MKKIKDYDEQEIRDMPAGDEKEELLIECMGHYAKNISDMEAFIFYMDRVGFETTYDGEYLWTICIDDYEADISIVHQTRTTHQETLATAILLLMREREMRK